MTREVRIGVLLAVLVALGFLVHLLSGILLPFVAAMAVAYFLDPLADRIEREGVSRALATLLITAAFFVAAIGLVVILFPLFQAQVLGLIAKVPAFIARLRELAEPMIQRLIADLPPATVDRLRDTAGGYAGGGLEWLQSVLAGLWSGGAAVLHVLSLVVITPVVAFYLLRDWDRIVARLDSLLPLDWAPTIREQLAAIDATIAAFARGQATVCLVLAVYYGMALSLVGLEFGLLVGFGAGLISFIPYAGAATGFAVGIGMAIAQFPGWGSVALVGAVFAVGQALESYALTPRLVGDRVGLHPVWVIFAILAGGNLFGFTGVLLAVPAAAVIGVLVRFAVKRYLEGAFYRGRAGGGEGDH